MNRSLLLIVFTIIVMGCNTNSSTDTMEEIVQDTQKVVSGEDTKFSFVAGCYQSVFNRDSATLTINANENVVTGDLNYNRYEKDDNTGSFEGVLRGQLMILNYNFQSEGQNSVRQVVFKIEGDTLIEGFGDVYVKGDTSLFKNITELQFDKSAAFVKRDCL